jgi:hypothetical protein
MAKISIGGSKARSKLRASGNGTLKNIHVA